jgi:hypothetical protein
MYATQQQHKSPTLQKYLNYSYISLFNNVTGKEDVTEAAPPKVSRFQVSVHGSKGPVHYPIS